MSELVNWKLNCHLVAYEIHRKDSKPFFLRDKQERIRKIMRRGFKCVVEIPPSISAY